jgi:hypothetical protein
MASFDAVASPGARQQTMPELTELADSARLLALERYRKLQPHLEQNVPLLQVARDAALPVRTARRWVHRYKRLPGAVVQTKASAAACHQRYCSSRKVWRCKNRHCRSQPSTAKFAGSPWPKVSRRRGTIRSIEPTLNQESIDPLLAPAGDPNSPLERALRALQGTIEAKGSKIALNTR